MEHKYRLSICMMVRDEEKNLGRCLESLKDYNRKKFAELIIVDTGFCGWHHGYSQGVYRQGVPASLEQRFFRHEKTSL
jgi:hypothetical protein